MVVLAVKGTAAEQAVAQCGDGLAGKIVLDTTNPIAESPPTSGVLAFFTGPNDSLLERLQKKVPSAKFVKAFNSVGAGLMVNPKLPSKPSMFICGNDSGAKEQTAPSSTSSAGRPRTWVSQRRRGRSNRSACCGASRGS